MSKQKQAVLVVLAALVVGWILSSLLVKQAAADTPEPYGLVTLFNRTSHHLNYQMRVMMRGENKYGPWRSHHHKYPGGSRVHAFYGPPDRISIRFDSHMGEHTHYKIYNVEYDHPQHAPPYRPHDGRPFSFKINRSGTLTFTSDPR